MSIVLFSFSMCITLALYFSLVLLLFLPLMDRPFFLKYVGSGFLIVFLILLGMRALAPVEFLFAREILCTNFVRDINNFFYHYIFFNEHEIFRGVFVIAFILGIAAIIFMVKIVRYYHFRRIIKYMPYTDSEGVHRVWRKLCEENPVLNKVKIVEADLPISPLYIGYLHPVIVLPRRKWTDCEYHYILLHEAYHYLHKDHLVKILLDLVCTVYWWNPLFYILRKKGCALLEIRNDERMAESLNDQGIREYVRCLLAAVYKINNCQMPFVLTFSKSNRKALTARVKLLRNRRRSKYTTVLAVLVMAFSVVLSFGFVLESDNDPNDGSFSLTPEIAYIIQRDEDVYDIYLHDVKIETVDDISYYPRLEVYKEEKE